MKIEEAIRHIRATAPNEDPFSTIEEELSEGLARYWAMAGEILEGSGVALSPPPKDYYSLSRNFFSMLFWYSYHRAGISPRRRVLYVAVNQCLRGMVTGCDNLLDEEYKATLLTDLPEKGTRVRSVLDIMVSDRVLFGLLTESRKDFGIDDAQVLAASNASLRALTRSAAQEASEEGGAEEILSPREVLDRVHHYKTGLLFQCVWAVPEVLEQLPPHQTQALKGALYDIGMGCQLLDDMVDFAMDLGLARHNYAASFITHAGGEEERKKLAQIRKEPRADEGGDLILEFPTAVAHVSETAVSFLKRGLNALLSPEHHPLAAPAIGFIARRIGAERFLGMGGAG